MCVCMCVCVCERERERERRKEALYASQMESVGDFEWVREGVRLSVIER